MAIRGRLSDMSLPTLVQMACQETAQARLTIGQEDVTAALFFEEGNLVHAMLTQGQDEHLGEEVVYRILGWEEGDFELAQGVVPPAHTVDAHWSMLLMDGLQRLDETRWDSLGKDEIEEEYEMAENLNDILQELQSQVPGFVATALIGTDGLGIAQLTSPGVDVDAINAQMTLLIKLVDTTIDKLKAGTMDHGILTTERAYLVWRWLPGKEYYLGLAGARNTANLGNLLLMSRLYAERVAKAMPR
ncbi:MAG: DUF4388 domain-containing protein [Anaerolineae bacterium]|nr:DUF4388 domain-containing protein [Anaerolineae bacterium]